MSERLAKYLDARIRNDYGWLGRYEKEVAGDRIDWLAGHYSGLIDDILKIIGEKQLQQLYFAIRDMQQKIKAVEENKNAAPIKWHKDGNDYVYEEGEDILMTISPLYANGYPDGYDRLGTYRCSVWADPTKRDDPVFRVTVESIEMGKHCLQTWLDQHGANWRSQPKIEVKRGKEKTKV